MPTVNCDPGRLRRQTGFDLPTGGEWRFRHDGGKDRTIRIKIPHKNIALAIISAPL